MSTLFYPLITKKISISRHIEKFEFNIGIMIISIWLIRSNGKYYFVATGMGKMAVYILNKYLNGEKLEAVFLTHGHSDHIDGLPALKGLTPTTRIHIDSYEFPYISGQEAYPRRSKSEKKRSIFLNLSA